MRLQSEQIFPQSANVLKSNSKKYNYKYYFKNIAFRQMLHALFLHCKFNQPQNAKDFRFWYLY